MTTTIILAAIIYFLTLITGVILSKMGRPYTKGMVAIHKLISLAAIVLLSIAIYYYSKDSALDATDVLLSIAAGVLFIVTAGSGALLAKEKTYTTLALLSHKLLPLVLLAVCIALVYRFY